MWSLDDILLWSINYISFMLLLLCDLFLSTWVLMQCMSIQALLAFIDFSTILVRTSKWVFQSFFFQFFHSFIALRLKIEGTSNFLALSHSKCFWYFCEFSLLGFSHNMRVFVLGLHLAFLEFFHKNFLSFFHPLIYLFLS